MDSHDGTIRQPSGQMPETELAAGVRGGTKVPVPRAQNEGLVGDSSRSREIGEAPRARMRSAPRVASPVLASKRLLTRLSQQRRQT